MFRGALFLALAAFGSGHKLSAVSGLNEADASKLNLRQAGSSEESSEARFFTQLAKKIMARQGDPAEFRQLLDRLVSEADKISHAANEIFRPSSAATDRMPPQTTSQPAAVLSAAPPRSIPKKLLFNHKINLLKLQPSQMDEHAKLLRENVLHTISIFPEVSREDVHFWDDADCESSLSSLNMKESEALTLAFVQEQVGMIKSDICRLAMVYTLGGYYFDSDLLVTPELKAQLRPDTTFVTVRAAGTDPIFFQAFLATVPKHPLMELALKEFKIWYDKLHRPHTDQALLRKVTGGGNIGCALLYQVYVKWAGSARETGGKVVHPGGQVSQFFDERLISQLAGYSGLLPGRSGYICDYAVVNSPSRSVVLYSRMYDSHNGKACREEVDLMRRASGR